VRAVVIAAALVCGAVIGLAVGILVGAVAPNEVLPPGVAPLVLGLIGGVGFAVLAGRSLPRKT